MAEFLSTEEIDKLLDSVENGLKIIDNPVSFKTSEGEEIAVFDNNYFMENKYKLNLRESTKTDRILFFVNENSKFGDYKVFKGDYFELIKGF